MKRTWLSAIAIVVVLVITWELVARFGGIPPYILPQPREVVSSTIQHAGVLRMHSLATLNRSISHPTGGVQDRLNTL